MARTSLRSADREAAQHRESADAPAETRAVQRSLAREVTQAGAQRAWRRLTLAFEATPFYRVMLRGTPPGRILHAPADLRRPSIFEADAIFRGRWRFAGHTVTVQGSPFAAEDTTPAWRQALHGFGWLRHVALGYPDEASAFARGQVLDWIGRHGRGGGEAWEPEVTARRLVAWLQHHRLVLHGIDILDRTKFMASIEAQARHLERAGRRAPPGLPRLACDAALALAGICLPDGGPRGREGLRRLARALDEQILSDGGHASRSPQALLDALTDVLTVREALVARGAQPPRFLQNALDRMLQMLRFFRHGDGGLALFHGGGEGPAEQVAALLKIDDARARPLASHFFIVLSDHLKIDDARARPLAHAPASAYARVAAQRTRVIVDAGTAPWGPYADAAHASALAFEMSSGAARIIVNCGPAAGKGTEWRDAARATAAHSTITIDDTSSAAILGAGMAQSLLGPRLVRGPQRITIQRQDSEGGTWLALSHDGYVAPFGITHHRRLYLDASGRDFRGEDRLEAGQGGAAHAFAARFHLHPDIRVSLAQDGRSAILKLANGEGWRFRVAHATLVIEPSVYLGGDAARRCEQLVIAGTIRPGEAATVAWAMKRIDEPVTVRGARAESGDDDTLHDATGRGGGGDPAGIDSGGDSDQESGPHATPPHTPLAADPPEDDRP